MADVTNALAPKSDQLNADDLIITGHLTAAIVKVVVRDSGEQLIDVFLEGHPRPWRPSKTSGRVMAAVWGKDSDSWVGEKVCLFRDPQITYGGVEVGGIAISHMSGISEPAKILVTVKRGKRAVYTVQPLAERSGGLAGKRQELWQLIQSCKMEAPEKHLPYASRVLKFEVKETSELGSLEAKQLDLLIDSLRKEGGDA